MSKYDEVQANEDTPAADELGDYRAISALAVAGLVLGIASVVALVHPLLWVVPAAAVAVNLAALGRIERFAPSLSGRKAALCGLVAALLFGVGAPTQWFSRRWLVRRDADQFVRVWFDYLAQDQPHFAHQLTVDPLYRQPLDEKLWNHYRGSRAEHAVLERFVRVPLVRSLLALGPKASVRYLGTEMQATDRGREALLNLYAVTFNEGARSRSFLVRIGVQRVWDVKAGVSRWQLIKAIGPEKTT